MPLISWHRCDLIPAGSSKEVEPKVRGLTFILRMLVDAQNAEEVLTCVSVFPRWISGHPQFTASGWSTGQPAAPHTKH